MKYNIAIDGPAGAGKSSVAKKVAKEIGFIYVDTGAMYRAIALYFTDNKIKMEDEEIVSALNNIEVGLTYVAGEQQVILNGQNVTQLIRREEIGNMASVVAKNREVRMKLLELQRELAKKEDVIMDGRDIGTHVLPDADLKIYLTASSRERANRRYKELCEKGISCDLDKIEQDIIARDEQDMNREVAPLKQAEDAIYLDTSDLSMEQVVEKIICMYKEKQ